MNAIRLTVFRNAYMKPTCVSLCPGTIVVVKSFSEVFEITQLQDEEGVPVVI